MILFFLTLLMISFVIPGDASAQRVKSRTSSLSVKEMAAQKSRKMAAIGINRLRKPYKSRYSNARYGMRHVGSGALPVGARYEGVGYSSYSARQAIRNASFYGRRPMVGARVARGRDGYFAAVYYR
ncbi:hypothetical protein [Rubripirellula obstinata]|nr:hypothetical protein [Rubripirellula obstinata]